MKEYSRALFGVGKYAEHLSVPTFSPAEIVLRAMGSSWKIEQDSLRIKPLRVQIYDGDQSAMFAWAPARDFKHLIWAALQASSDGDTSTWVLTVVEPFTDPTPSNMKLKHRRIGEKCGFEVFHVSL